jgi:hypothetical protein
VQYIGATLCNTFCLSPDGRFKFPDLWPVKFLRAGPSAVRRAASSVAIVVCKYGFKTFTPVPLFEGKHGKRPARHRRLARPALQRVSRRDQVGEFGVATRRGIWVAIGGFENRQKLSRHIALSMRIWRPAAHASMSYLMRINKSFDRRTGGLKKSARICTSPVRVCILSSCINRQEPRCGKLFRWCGYRA